MKYCVFKKIIYGLSYAVILMLITINTFASDNDYSFDPSLSNAAAYGTKLNANDGYQSITRNASLTQPGPPNWLLIVIVLIVVSGVLYRNRIIQQELEKRILIQDKLAISEQKFRTLFDLSPVLINAFDDDGRCTLWNKECEKVFGWTLEELNDHKSPLALFYPDVKVQQEVLKAIRTSDQNSFKEWYPRTKDDRTLVTLLANITLPSGEIINIGYDISRQRKKELEVNEKTQELKEQKAQLTIAKKNAEKANKSKSEFLANMSHEIRTPMNGVIGILNLLQRTKLTEQQASYIGKINTSSQLLLEIINDILDFSRIEAGKLNIEKIHFSLPNVLSNIENIMQIKASENNLLFFITNNSNYDIFYGDPLRLSQVLINLINNAIKFTHEGKVELKIESINNDHMKFSVIDTGIGISDKQKISLFQAFNQLDNSTTRKYGGSGLGLSISKQLIELMDGHIGLKSVLHKGSDFFFEILLAKGDVNKVAFKRHEQTKVQDLSLFENKHILLVEDNIINQDVLSLFLIESGFTISVANNGQEALEKLSQSDCTFDLVLMDIHMPVMDGYESSRKIRKTLKYTEIPIIALTANVVQDVEIKCRQSGMNDFLSKPVDYNHLLNVLSRHLKDSDQDQDKNIKWPVADGESLAVQGGSETLPGIVQSRARKFLGDDIEQLKKVLIQFREQYEQSAQQLKEFLLQKNYSEAYLLAHSIKGVSAIFGAQELCNASLALEKLLQFSEFDSSDPDGSEPDSSEPDSSELKKALQDYKKELIQIIKTSHLIEKQI